MRADRLTVLLVDDEPDLRWVYATALRSSGDFTVIEADNGTAAVRVTADTRPDVVLLDVMLPGMNGPDVLATLRANPETAGIPVVFFTAKALPSEIAELRALEPADVLIKPCRPKDLFERLLRAVAQAASGSPGE